jgi:diadenosine tetraphosphatase ApaH/serine/threonine PP2A family protein phosphatase
MTEHTSTRYGVVADVHANLQALTQVVQYLDDARVEAIYCLGDVVGYGGDPEDCIQIIRERCAGTVRGNHDHAVVDPSLRGWFNEHARRAVERQAELLSPPELAWLAELPPTIDLDGVTLGHGGFANPGRYRYIRDETDAVVEFGALATRYGLVGHTHVPAVFAQTADGEICRVDIEGGEDAAAVDEREVPLGPYRGAIINPGAVGQPRDRDPRAACAVLDLGSDTVRIVRLEYDIAAAQDAIDRRGLPRFEAARLAMGL